MVPCLSTLFMLPGDQAIVTDVFHLLLGCFSQVLCILSSSRDQQMLPALPLTFFMFIALLLYLTPKSCD